MVAFFADRWYQFRPLLKITPYLRENGSILTPQRKKLYNSPKILIAKIAIRTEAFLDKKGEFASLNTNCIHSFTKDFHYKYVNAWINSLLYQFVFSCYFDGLRMAGGYLLYSSPNIKSTFIKKPDDKFTSIICLLHDIMESTVTTSKFNLFDTIMDSIFYELYFAKHMEVRGINIMAFIEKDISEVIEEREFEHLDDIDKKQLINNLHTKWSHPNNEVRNRIKLFAVRSPEILKPILES